MITIDPNKPHAAIPVEGTESSDATAHTTAECRWCGRRIQQSHSHMGQSARWSHPAKTFTK
jgi:hypothetical protein